MSLTALVFFFGIYIAGLVIAFTLGCGDPEGRFKYRYAIFWPLYLYRFLKGKSS